MAVDVSQPMKDKMAAVEDYPILDSQFAEFKDGSPAAEITLGTKGWYISSPEDGWQLRGPFASGL